MPRTTASIKELFERVSRRGAHAGDAPTYDSLGMLDEVVEIRRYAPATLVSTSVRGTHAEALREGWRRLSRFVEAGGAAAHLRMLPALVQGEAEEADDIDADLDVEQIDAWTVAAYVVTETPGELRLEDGDDVRVIEVLERWVASVGYLSADTARARDNARTQLLDSVSHHREICPLSTPYWVLTEGFARLASRTRNEAQIEIDAAHLPKGLTPLAAASRRRLREPEMRTT